ncbi:GDSL-like Lipase/Acylhydrolase superfamily protein [Perilla frutescens var. hirtella]|uniref:GDSL-like Lipase/Acylhydrolase superfamily protein n=1 Tax=Perilla frutescens var. hirtella TaxID=608512 RepID=A0AAD4JQM3_PERFH|nr:GDSL-like Lipase/Acylhydrolase superfamily protein [Perilla frutescens var. hirtella]
MASLSTFAPAALCLLLLCFILGGAAASVPAVIVFGDSSVDAGNNNQLSTVLKSNFRPYGRDFYGGRPTGRFSNGRIPPDFISEAFGLRPFVPAYLDPQYNISDFAGGVCFASAGTGYDNATSNVLNVIPLWKEIEYYKEYQNKLKAYAGEAKANSIVNEALYLVSLGTNDFLENYYTLPDTRSKYTVDQFQDFLVGLVEKFVKEIYDLGARKISLTGLPPMGCLPLERSTNYVNGNGNGCMEGYNLVALHFNGKLNGLVKKMNMEMPGIRVVFSNPYGIFMQMIKKPSQFGFEVVSVACCATGMFEMGYMCDQLNPFTCSDANKYVFWDSFHPTQKSSSIIADYLLKHSLRQFL